VSKNLVQPSGKNSSQYFIFYRKGEEDNIVKLSRQSVINYVDIFRESRQNSSLESRVEKLHGKAEDSLQEHDMNRFRCPQAAQFG
jgi:hypothetical protein